MNTVESTTLALEAKPNGNGAPFAIEAITYPIAIVGISELAKEYMGLTVATPDDQAGLKLVHAARINVKKTRCAIENRRKELNARSLQYTRNVNGMAKQLTDMLEPIENHLISQEEIVTKEKERLAKIEAERIRERNQVRLTQLADCDTMMDPAQVALMPDEQFAMILKAKQEAYAEKKRVEAEQQAGLAAETARLKAESDRLATIRAEQEAAQKKIDADRRALAGAEGARLREAELEQARQDAAERSRVETENRIAREREEADVRAKAAETSRLKIEAMKPDKLKLLAVADAVNKIEVPSVSPDAKDAVIGVLKILSTAEQKIRKLANDLSGESTPGLFE